QPAIAVQTRASIGEIRFDIDLRHAPRVCHPFCDGWLFGQCLLEKIFRGELGFTKSFAVENHSDAGSLFGEWNEPEPAINSTNQNCQRPVNSLRTPDTVVMREDRQLLKMLVGLFDFELPAEHCCAPAGSQKKMPRDGTGRAVESDRQLDTIGRELD